HRRRHEIVHRDSFLGEEIVEFDVVTVLGGTADPLAVTDNDVAKLTLRIELVEEAIGIARPRNELVLHLNSGFGGEVFRKLHQGIGRIPRRPTQRQLFGLSNRLTSETRGDKNRSHPQCTHLLDHHNLPVVAGECLCTYGIFACRPATSLFSTFGQRCTRTSFARAVANYDAQRWSVEEHETFMALLRARDAPGFAAALSAPGMFCLMG